MMLVPCPSIAQHPLIYKPMCLLNNTFSLMAQIHAEQITVCLLNHLEQLFSQSDVLASGSLRRFSE